MKKIFILLAATVLAIGCSNGYDSVDAQEFSEALKNPDVQIIDTRTPQEFSEGHIPGAVNIDLDGEDFFDKMDCLDKDKPVAVYCRGGRRSKIAAERFVGKAVLTVLRPSSCTETIRTMRSSISESRQGT